MCNNCNHDHDHHCNCNNHNDPIAINKAIVDREIANTLAQINQILAGMAATCAEDIKNGNIKPINNTNINKNK